MARITYFNALGEGGLVTTFYDAATLHVTTSTATQATMQDASGARVIFTGTGLVFDGDQPTAGIVTGVNLYDSAGHLLAKVTAANIAATDLFVEYQSLGLIGVELALIERDDRIIGSDKGDFILGQGGNDTLLGGKGGDIFNGGKGRDKMTGGAGADTFYFIAKDGTDTITDFTDTGKVATRDHIHVTQAQYDHMTATQVGADLDLHFGGKDHLILLGFDLASLDKSDFSLG